MMNKIIDRIWAAGLLTIMIASSACSYFGPCLNGSGPVSSEFRDLANFSGVSNTGSFIVYVSEADSFSVEVVAQENLLPVIETYVSGGTLIIETRNRSCYRSSSAVEIYVSLPDLDLLSLSGSGTTIADLASGPDVELANSGSGFMEVDSVFAGSCLISNSGSGQISLTGVVADEADLIQSGSGTIAGGVFPGAADLSIRHSSSGRVFASVLNGTVVDVILSGSGKVELTGDAMLAEYSLNSSGRLDALNLEVPDVDANSKGSGDLFVWATDFLDATITASGSIYYRGNPQLTSSITGSGNVRPY